MMLGSFTAGFQHGLLVISAPESTDAHEDWDAATENVHAGPDSLYCGVQQAASGLVSVTCIEDEDVRPGLTQVFSGSLDLPSRRLALYDPNATIRMVVPVGHRRVGIEIYADVEEDPARLIIRLTAADGGFS